MLGLLICFVLLITFVYLSLLLFIFHFLILVELVKFLCPFIPGVIFRLYIIHFLTLPFSHLDLYFINMRV